VKVLKYLLVALAIAVGGLAIAWNLSEPPPLPATSPGAALLAPGPWKSGFREYELVDASRRTDANGDFPGAPERRLRARVWYPAAGDGKQVAEGPFPLIAYSHGFSGDSSEPTYLAQYLASHGYVIIAADFPLTNYGAPGGPSVYDVVNQPGDVSFLIDTMLAWSADAAGDWTGRIDPARIGIAGLSLGGMTTELTAFHPRLHDPRVKVAVSIAGPLQLFGRAFFAASDVPFMMVAGDIDAMVPYQDNGRPVLDRVNNAWLVTVPGGSHTGFANQASALRWMDNADAIGCYFVRGKTPKSGDTKDGTDLYELLGSEQEGVLRNMKNELCLMDPLPPAMSPLEQHRITMLAVRSFLESVLNHDAAQQARFRDYLQTGLARDFDGVSVERSHPQT